MARCLHSDFDNADVAVIINLWCAFPAIAKHYLALLEERAQFEDGAIRMGKALCEACDSEERLKVENAAFRDVLKDCKHECSVAAIARADALEKPKAARNPVPGPWLNED